MYQGIIPPVHFKPPTFFYRKKKDHFLPRRIYSRVSLFLAAIKYIVCVTYTVLCMITIETIRIWYGTLKFSSENLSLTKVTENGNMYSLNYHLSYIYILYALLLILREW